MLVLQATSQQAGDRRNQTKEISRTSPHNLVFESSEPSPEVRLPIADRLHDDASTSTDTDVFALANPRAENSKNEDSMKDEPPLSDGLRWYDPLTGNGAFGLKVLGISAGYATAIGLGFPVVATVGCGAAVGWALDKVFEPVEKGEGAIILQFLCSTAKHAMSSVDKIVKGIVPIVLGKPGAQGPFGKVFLSGDGCGARLVVSSAVLLTAYGFANAWGMAGAGFYAYRALRDAVFPSSPAVGAPTG